MGHTSLPENSNIRLVFKLDKTFTKAVKILLYQELDASFQIDRQRKVTTDF